MIEVLRRNRAGRTGLSFEPDSALMYDGGTPASDSVGVYIFFRIIRGFCVEAVIFIFLLSFVLVLCSRWSFVDVPLMFPYRIGNRVYYWIWLGPVLTSR